MSIKSLSITAILTIAILCVSPAGAMAASLTATQISTIIGLLQAFGVDSATIASVQTTLNGGVIVPNPTIWCHDFNKNIGVGNSAGDVQYLGKVLKELGFTAGAAGSEGAGYYYDEQTASGVIQFQKKYNIFQTGYVGSLTRAKLNSLYGCSVKPQCSVDTDCPSACMNAIGTNAPNFSCISLQCVSGKCVPQNQGQPSITSISVQRPNLTVTGKKLSSVKIYLVPTGSGINPDTDSTIVSASAINDSNGNQTWNYKYPQNLLLTSIFAKGYDASGNLVGRVDLPITGASAISDALYGTENINGVCGSAQGTSFSPDNKPATGALCSSGAPSALSAGGNTWSWTCAGVNQGMTASCSANFILSTQPSITFQSPRNGDVFTSNTPTVPFSWTSTSPLASPFAVIFNVNNPSQIIAPVQTLTPNTTSGTGSFVITTPLATQYVSQIKICDGPAAIAGAAQKCVLSGYFTIGSTNQPSVTVTSPNGGETWRVGETHNITWSTQNLPQSANVIISLNIMQGTTYTTLIDTVTNTGSYSWKIPSVLQNLNKLDGYNVYKVNVSVTDLISGKTAYDSGDGYLSILASGTNINGACGSAQGTTFSPINQPTSSALCSSGTPSALSAGGNTWSWTCVSASLTAICSANFVLSTQTSVTVTSPNGGEVINPSLPLGIDVKLPTAGYRLYFNLVDANNAAFDLLSYNNITSYIASNSSIAVSLNLPSSWVAQHGTSYKVEVCANSSCDRSDNYFTISAK